MEANITTVVSVPVTNNMSQLDILWEQDCCESPSYVALMLS